MGRAGPGLQHQLLFRPLSPTSTPEGPVSFLLPGDLGSGSASVYCSTSLGLHFPIGKPGGRGPVCPPGGWGTAPLRPSLRAIAPLGISHGLRGACGGQAAGHRQWPEGREGRSPQGSCFNNVSFRGGAGRCGGRGTYLKLPCCWPRSGAQVPGRPQTAAWAWGPPAGLSSLDPPDTAPQDGPWGEYARGSRGGSVGRRTEAGVRG